MLIHAQLLMPKLSTLDLSCLTSTAAQRARCKKVLACNYMPPTLNRQAAQVIIRHFGSSHTALLLPPLEEVAEQKYQIATRPLRLHNSSCTCRGSLS